MNFLIKNQAYYFIFILGLVSFFADVTYEGARSVIGPYLSVLGASAAIVGAIAGLGELVGYSLRVVSGFISDKTERYWTITFLGYTINLLAVPLLAFAWDWKSVAVLIVIERLGKAIRNPARDALLSYATKETGRGWGFGIHNALDQAGAIIGPLSVSAILYLGYSYQTSFLYLAFPAICAISLLGVAIKIYPMPKILESVNLETAPQRFSRVYWVFLAATSFVAVGYIDFALIAFYFQKAHVIETVWIPIFYSLAMAAQGFSSLIFGKLFDKVGWSVLIYVVAIALFFAPMIFFGTFGWKIIGVMLWGIGLGAQGTIMRAVVADLSHISKRGTAYGLLNMSFGVAWFSGSAIMGLLYDQSFIYLVIFSMSFQALSIPLFLIAKRYFSQMA